MSAISQHALGKWPSILTMLGVDQEFLKNKHGPCPICGGKDRFRFDDKGGKGSYFCSGCGAGDGFNLLQKLNGWSFAETAKHVEEIIGSCRATPAAQDDSGKNEARLKRIHAGLRRIAHDDPVSRYLLSRGITILPKQDVYFHPGMDYFTSDANGKSVKVGTFPAMVAIFRNLAGATCTFHITYLTPDGQKIAGHPAKKFLPAIQPLPGGAIRLGGIGEQIGFAEGIESALAAMQDHQIPCWAAGNANLLEQVLTPEPVKSVVIFADEDASFTGQKAAYTLANRLKVQFKKEVSVARILGKEGPVKFDVGLDIDYADRLQPCAVQTLSSNS
jgi:putative DNA primase/helicase